MLRKDRIFVMATPRGPVFLPGHKRQLDSNGRDVHAVHPGEAQEVANTRYIRTRIAAGDLIEVDPDLDKEL